MQALPATSEVRQKKYGQARNYENRLPMHRQPNRFSTLPLSTPSTSKS